MKARMSKTGMLIVTPENETEMYALRRWSLQYNDDKSENPASLHIAIEEKDGEK